MKYRCDDCGFEWVSVATTSVPTVDYDDTCPECESEDIETRVATSAAELDLDPGLDTNVSNEPLMEFGPLSHGRPG